VKWPASILLVAAIVAGATPGLATPNLPPETAIAADPARPWLIPPVDGPIVARFQAPGTDWGPGHRGIDYYAAVDTAVRAAGAGTVAFAGSVAGVNAVTIEHTGGLSTTYTNLAEVLVDEGAYVLQGEWIGRVGVAHGSSGDPGLHFGVKVDGSYVNPEDYLGPVDVAGAIHLTPLIGDWARDTRGYGAGSYLDEECRDPGLLVDDPAAPNDNIAVVVPGLGSESPSSVAHKAYDLAARLGYPEARTYFFSYEGSDAPNLHEPYSFVDTSAALHESAGKLATMLVRIAHRHPGTDVDLVTFSQGGLIARDALERMMTAWGPGTPRVDHLITYATPHSGSKLAEFPDELRSGSISGAVLTDAVSRWARSGGPLPDPFSAAVGDLRPDSAFLDELADHDVVFGTRVLSLSSPNDWVVPASRASYEGARNEIVPASGMSGHIGILWSEEARALAYGFLKDAPPACQTDLDHLTPMASRLTDFLHDHAAELYAAGEDKFLGVMGRLWRRIRRR
jgi:hypothetical protein